MKLRLGRAGVLVGVVWLLSSGCGPNEEVAAAKRRAEAWQVVVAEHQALATARTTLRDLQARLQAGVADDARAALESEIAAAGDAVNSQIESFMPKLVQYINNNPVVIGEQPTTEQAAALRMKSDEDIELAAEYMEQGGDYRRAIEILEKTAEADPDYDQLKQKLEHAKAYRFTTKERFDGIAKDMSQDQVRANLGQVFLRNIREYPEQKAVAWFYPRDPEVDGPGAASAVFFKQNKEGAWVVYQTQWDAVKGGTREAD